ncbi:MAG: hypothetical protein ACXABO_18375 [Promethearchaeota archaeon]|jgi:hypothetical protein
MLVLKHVEYEISDKSQLKMLINHLIKTTKQIKGIRFIDIYFPINKEEFILFLECENEKEYQAWRKICPPPDNANDWYEVFLTKEENFK